MQQPHRRANEPALCLPSSAEQQAYDLGRDAALAAASWVIDGNTKPEAIAYVVALLDAGDPAVLDWSTGWGSVSDQNGMNTAFRVLGLPFRFDRDARGGGPRITELRRHPCGHITDPAVLRCCDRKAAA